VVAVNKMILSHQGLSWCAPALAY